MDMLLKQQDPLGEQAGMPTMGPPGTPWGELDPTKTTLGGGQPGGGQQGGGFGAKLGQALNSPLGVLGMNLLAQSGPSLTPRGPADIIGQAGLATQANLSAQQKMALDRRLIESRIGVNKAAALQSGNPTANNVQTTFKGENGNMHIVTRAGEVKDTGVAFNSNVQFFEQDDGTVIGVNKSTGDRIGTVISPQEAAAASTRKKQTEKQQTLPTDIAGLDTSLAKIDATIGKVEKVLPLVKDSTVGVESVIRGNLPGALGGEARQLKQAVKSLQANLGFDTLNQMRQASKSGGALGQVSERELDLLVNAVEALDLEGDPETLRTNLNNVILHYNNYKREIENMKNAMRREAGQPAESAQPKPTKRYNPQTGKIEAM